MSSASAGTRLVTELLGRLRRSGLPISTAQAIMAAQAVAMVPWEKSSVKVALRAVLATTAQERALFERAFESFFHSGVRDLSLKERLSAKGLSEAELLDLREVLEADAGYLSRGATFDQTLYREIAPLLEEAADRRVGPHTYRILGKLGQAQTLAAFEPLKLYLRDAYGEARALEILSILQEEERATAQLVRELVQNALTVTAPAPGATQKLFDTLDPVEFEAVKRSVKRLAESLSTGLRTRKKRLKRRRIDGPRTLRAALQTQGVPLRLLYRSRVRRRPRLVLICDLSDSVRRAARLLLELLAGAHALFQDTRSFVFVSEVYETTTLFVDHGAEEAFQMLASGKYVPTSHLSNYGRALRQFEREHLTAINRDTTVLILGDGRTNFHDPGEHAVRAIQKAARSVYWLVPEARARWREGDSAMHLFEPLVTKAFEVATVAQLEAFARFIARAG